jgi:nicotinamide mononucleotide transporter
MDWLSIDHIAFTIFDYPLSYLELIGALFGLVSVYLAAKSNILTWPIAIINEAAFFFLFFQIQLYSDMLLQGYFFIITIYGWYFWKKNSSQQSVSRLSHKHLLIYSGLLVVGTVLLGLIMASIHTILPQIFEKPTSFAYADAFTTIASVLATILLSRKKIETWVLWILVDLFCVFIYAYKGVHLIAFEYAIFLIICLFGFRNWRRLL